MPRDFQSNLDSLRKALEQQRFPLHYCHKFIGHNSPVFKDAVAGLETRFPKAVRTSARGSGTGHDQPRYLALTYELDAVNVEEVLELVSATFELAELKIIL